MRYSCLAPGKRLRPSLMMASADAVSADPLTVLDAACAVEMVHAFSLIHDDLPAIDDDDLRRGRPTCHVEFGDALAVLAGDALFALAFQVMSSAPGPAEAVVDAVRELSISSGSNGLVGGEVMDVLSEGQEVDAATVEAIHLKKTAALIAASCRIGGSLGGGTKAQCGALSRYGTEVGLAFQIADDLLNETSTPEQLGKAIGSDRARKKATYPGLHGFEESKAAARRCLSRGLAALDGAGLTTGALRSLASFAVDRDW